MPHYIINKQVIRDNYHNIRKMLEDCEIFYALKANSDEGVIEVLCQEGSSFECVSIREYELVKRKNVLDDRIIFGLPIKSVEVINYLYIHGCRNFVFDNIQELELLENYSPEAKKILRIYVSDISYVSIQFGMEYDSIIQSVNNDNLLRRIDGVSFHISENTDINIISCVLERVKKLLEMMKNNNTNSEYILDIGGGYSLNAPDEYYDLLKAQLNEIRKNYNVRIIAEPGTAIAKTSGKYITKVLRIKEREFFTEVFIDGGLPHGVVHPPSGVEIIKGNCEKTKRRIYRFIDNTSLRRVITTTHLRRNIQKGDIIGFLDYGAYSTVYQNDFHMWERAEIEYVD